MIGDMGGLMGGEGGLERLLEMIRGQAGQAEQAGQVGQAGPPSFGVSDPGVGGDMDRGGMVDNMLKRPPPSPVLPGVAGEPEISIPEKDWGQQIGQPAPVAPDEVIGSINPPPTPPGMEGMVPKPIPVSKPIFTRPGGPLKPDQSSVVSNLLNQDRDIGGER